MSLSGGCQCGGVRFRAERLGRASICHCRMCQKAMGGFFGPFVDVYEFVWTRGAPKYFQSSNLVKRGFCGDCGTPLSFEGEGWPVNIAIGAFDHPQDIPPTLQVGTEGKLPYIHALSGLPERSPAEAEKMVEVFTAITSNQHPDHDTDVWPPA